jgi:hypothetical protein
MFSLEVKKYIVSIKENWKVNEDLLGQKAQWPDGFIEEN